jgi:beta-lactamase superfamily II metal-dependent hydrolase
MPFSNWYIYDLTKGMVISVLAEARAGERRRERSAQWGAGTERGGAPPTNAAAAAVRAPRAARRTPRAARECCRPHGPVHVLLEVLVDPLEDEVEAPVGVLDVEVALVNEEARERRAHRGQRVRRAPVRGAAALQQTGRRRLAVVVSHGHLDHTGGLVPVVAELEVTVVWATDHAGLGPLRAVAAARGIPWAWPPAAAYGAPTSDEPNDRSLIWRDGPFLLPGDLEATGEPGVAGGPPAAAPVLKVAHHGSAGATTEALLDAVRPRIAVVSAGRGNGYGHPHDALLERLRARGVRLWRTDVHGTVSVAAAPGGLRVQSWRPGAGWTPPVTVGEMP